MKNIVVIRPVLNLYILFRSIVNIWIRGKAWIKSITFDMSHHTIAA